MDILVAGWLLKGFEVSNEFFEIFLREKWREIVVNLGKNNEKLTILKEKSTLMSKNWQIRWQQGEIRLMKPWGL